jgi:prephenate dehydrogenase
MRVALLGVGLIGGSIGLAVRRRTGAHVVGYDPDAQALSRAVEVGAIDAPAFEVADAVHDADVVFVAAPVGSATQLAELALGKAGADCAISDVGSTKRAIVEAISDARFVGGHPLAGSERGGVENARVDLFEGATWYLTPPAGAQWSAAGASLPADAAPWAVERLRGLIERIGARPVAIDSETHDRLMANVSHLPHVFANVLVAQAAGAIDSGDLVPRGGDLGPRGGALGPRGGALGPRGGALGAEGGALGAGPSFRDATRVAGANTAIWTDIYLSNRDAVIEAIDDALRRLGEVRAALQERDGAALAAWNERAREQRERLRQAGLAPDS